MIFDGSHPDGRYRHLSIQERYWIHDRPARHHRLLRARRGHLPDRCRGLLRAAADRAPCRRRRHRARLRAQGDRRPRSAARDLVARGQRGRRGLRVRPHRAARAEPAHRLPPPEDPGRRRPGPAREARGVGALLPRARGAGRRRAPAQHRRRPQLQRHHRLLMGARLGHTLSGTLSGILSGALSGIAARIAAVPGMERWIGPDDGAVVAQSLSLAALAWPGRAHQQAVVPLELGTPAVLSRRATPSSAPGTREKCAHTPRFSRWTRPASTRVFRWWETVGWLSPSGTVRSHTQASPPSLAASNEITRSRAGSAIALSTEASPMASSAARGAVCSGAQQATASIGEVSSASSQEAMVTGRTVMDPVSLLY